MSKSDYRDLEVWQKARALATCVYRLSATFPRHELFGLSSQMRRAAVSVPCNIAEGHGRRTNADRINFFVIARGSLLEIETQALIATDLEYADVSAADTVVARTMEVTRLLNGLIRYYAGRPK
jgi:four helix bundle protein